jgi:hypothetical protein
MSRRRSQSSRARTALLVVLLGTLSGCSLFVRPVPGADRNLRCLLEYRPDPTHESDILFTALANPYEVPHHSPVDVFLHLIVAPGRHLSEPLIVRGAVCESPWKEGKRLPRIIDEDHYVLCRREGLAEVVIMAQTKWGVCARVIPEGDDRPRCRRWPLRSPKGLRFLSPVSCSQ